MAATNLAKTEVVFMTPAGGMLERQVLVAGLFDQPAWWKNGRPGLE